VSWLMGNFWEVSPPCKMSVWDSLSNLSAYYKKLLGVSSWLNL
jgi:hypothetical protein